MPHMVVLLRCPHGNASEALPGTPEGLPQLTRVLPRAIEACSQVLATPELHGGVRETVGQTGRAPGVSTPVPPNQSRAGGAARAARRVGGSAPRLTATR